MHHPLPIAHRKGMILGYLQIIHRFRPRYHLPACHHTHPSARKRCIPSLIWPTGKKPCSRVKNGCFWLVCTTSLVFATLPPGPFAVVVMVRSTRSWLWLIHTCRMGFCSILPVLGLYASTCSPTCSVPICCLPWSVVTRVADVKLYVSIGPWG